MVVLPRQTRTLVGVALLALLPACTAAVAEPPATSTSPATSPSPAETPARAAAATQAPSDPVTVLDGDAAALALAATQAVWQASPLVVLAGGDDASLAQARSVALDLRAPVLLLPSAAEPGPTASPSGEAGTAATPAAPVPLEPGLAAELARLGATSVVVVGASAVMLPTGVELVPAGQAQPQEAVPVDLVALTAPDAQTGVAAASLEAAGATVVALATADPRSDPAAIDALSAQPQTPVVALGGGFGTAERLAPLVAVASTGVELPGGGQTLFPGRRLVALYGHPQTSALGVLGEQGPQESVARARQVAASYAELTDVPVVPAFEIIATVASADAGADGNYSNETPVEVLRPYVEAAGEAGVYVVLDLQPGRTDFLTQAQQYSELLVLPHVGLALDPEWRLRPDQVHLRQIGTVDAAEITAVADWLAALVRDRALPQKLLLLHQFQQRMISNRETLDATRDELALLVQMDGDGAPGDKFATWEALQAGAPEGLLFGWKNFYDEDTPTFTPEQTMAVEPTPWWVSYQ